MEQDPTLCRDQGGLVGCGSSSFRGRKHSCHWIFAPGKRPLLPLFVCSWHGRCHTIETLRDCESRSRHRAAIRTTFGTCCTRPCAAYSSGFFIWHRSAQARISQKVKTLTNR